MLLVVLNDKQASGIKVQNAKQHAQNTQPKIGNIRITRLQKDGRYVVIFSNHLSGYAFGAWLNDHSVENEIVEVRDNAELGQKLVELLPDLANEIATGLAGNPKAQLRREETIQLLVQSILNPTKPQFSLFR